MKKKLCITTRMYAAYYIDRNTGLHGVLVDSNQSRLDARVKLPENSSKDFGEVSSVYLSVPQQKKQRKATKK